MIQGTGLRRALTVLALTAAAGALSGRVAGAAPASSTEEVAITGPVVSCGSFDVVANLLMVSRTDVQPQGRATIHLRLTGTLRNSVSGLEGRYAEVQVDASTRSGVAFSAGLLSKLTVPGHGTTSFAVGRGGVTADGTAFFTPHATGAGDEDGFVAAVCEALQ